MTLAELRTVVKAMVPGGKPPDVLGADNVLLDLIIAAGVRDITAYCECLPGNKQFAAVASQGDILDPYIITTEVSDYLSMASGGLWWNQSGDSDAPDYKKLNPRTVGWLDENRPNWHEIEDGDPEDYAIEGNNLFIVPAPVDALATAFWMFYTKMPPAMTSPSVYPFSGTTTELGHMSIFDFSIIYFARWKILPMLAKEYAQDEFNRNQNLYITERTEKLSLYRRRSDIAQTGKFQAPVIR